MERFRSKLISITIYARGSTPAIVIVVQSPISLATETIELTRQEAKELYRLLTQ